MTAGISRLPAGGCRYFEQDRCLLEERRNPGFRRDWRCGVLHGWETAYDEFLDRAEAFGLSPAEVSRLWRSRLAGLVERAADCPSFARRGAGATGCVHEFEALCLLLLPRCEGMCSRYERREAGADAEGGGI